MRQEVHSVKGTRGLAGRRRDLSPVMVIRMPADVFGKRTGFRVQGAGCRVQGARFRVQGSGCKVQGAGCRVQGAGLRTGGVPPEDVGEAQLDRDLVGCPLAARALVEASPRDCRERVGDHHPPGRARRTHCSTQGFQVSGLQFGFWGFQGSGVILYMHIYMIYTYIAIIISIIMWFKRFVPRGRRG